MDDSCQCASRWWFASSSASRQLLDPHDSPTTLYTLLGGDCEDGMLARPPRGFRVDEVITPGFRLSVAYAAPWLKLYCSQAPDHKN